MNTRTSISRCGYSQYDRREQRETFTFSGVELLEGRIEVENQVGLGTTFTVRLPLANGGASMSNRGLLRVCTESR